MVRQSSTIRSSSNVLLWCQIELLINPLRTSIFFQQKGNSEYPVRTMIAELWANDSLEEPHFSEVIELTNQVRSGTLYSPQWAATTTASLLLLWLSLPARSDNSQCEMHRARKSAYASSLGQGTARQLKPGPIPIHFHCLCNSVWPSCPKLSTLWPSMSSVFQQSTGWCLCPDCPVKHTHTHTKTVSHWCQHVRISTLVSSTAPPGTLSLPLSQGKSQRGRQIVWWRR